MQLGGKGNPTFHPTGFSPTAISEYVEGTSLIGMIQEDEVAQRVAVDSHREMIAYLRNEDPTTRRMLEGIAFSRVHSARPTRDSSHAHVTNASVV